MSESNTMASQRPPFQQHQSVPNGFPPHFPPPPPQPGLPFPSAAQHSSPTPQFSQIPANKRPRLSPNAQSSFQSPQFSTMKMPHAGSPVNGAPMNGVVPAPAPPGSMGPPSRPVDKVTDIRTLEDPLAGTGVNIDDEERNLTAPAFPTFGQHTANSSFQSQGPSFGSISTNGSFERPHTAGPLENGFSQIGGNYQAGLDPSRTISMNSEEFEKRKEVDANWQAARHSQHHLWNPFLQGDPLERKLNERAYEHGIKSPKDGLYYATKTPDKPPQRTRVEGLDGAVQIIDRGQTIISTPGGDVLGDIMKLISLAAKDRLTGLLDVSARLAQERRETSKGKVPVEWQSVAAVQNATIGAIAKAVSLPTANILKRSHSQISADAGAASIPAAPHRLGELFRKISETDRAAEEARLAKRARRQSSANPDTSRSGSFSAQGGLDTPTGLLLESEKRPTKKDRKAAESKFSEAMQHKSANEAARMATSSLLGGKFGGKKKTYAWMSGGSNTPKTISSPTQIPARIDTTVTQALTVSASDAVRTSATPNGNHFGQWDEDNEPGIQQRDVLLVLETDGKAPRSLLRGYNIPEGRS